ncbi:esterase-like activity of phytase family protein [Jannaschia pohangensis]|uniref:Esterase-like activity of phytase n=1 Tax=Jannaschia pohangensis TaxID=390807 RepID=A0A1I3UBR2_9RHOB|nr:esterase-like activity of phytase family protein [Jannaschia pohangensis]SFJ80978.1 Esterase-like activity of phytase [Jannaschia pohangensis]
MTRHLLLSCGLLALASAAHGEAFNRIASFPVTANLPDDIDPQSETAPEIITVSGDGRTLIYTDSLLGALGLIDIANPASPQPLGLLKLDGEPTSVAMARDHVLAAVNTSDSFTDPSGVLLALTLPDLGAAASCDLGGQPDAVAVAPDVTFAAIAVENERDEDLNDGALPQLPAGHVVLVDLGPNGLPDCASARRVDLTGLADVAPTDPEPEFLAINDAGEIAVTLQENNHLVVLSRTGSIITHFSAGSVDLTGIDALDDRGALIFDQDQPGRLREPDAVAWIDDAHFATANEGDYEGGSRGWTIWSKDGSIVWDSGTSFEHAIVEIGHYPDRRSDAKGVEPESVAFAVVDGIPLVFVGAERAGIIGVYDVSTPAAPVLRQLLPSGVGPEGIAVVPGRNLLITANEGDLVEDGAARAHVMIYDWQDGPPAYPHLTSAGTQALLGWGALSGLAAVGDRLFAVSDSFYALQPRIFEVDATATPARILRAIDVTRDGRPAELLDLEGIAPDGEGGFWLVSEGRTDRDVPHALLRVDATGEIRSEVALPDVLLAGEQRFGMEGVTAVDGVLWIAMQREWGDDPDGMVKLLRHDPATGEWAAMHYPLEQATTGWVGLSEIAAYDGQLYILERDNQSGTAAEVKLITRVALDGLTPAPLGGPMPVARKDIVRDLMTDLTSTGGFVLDKVEGLAITDAGRAFVVTDNDGVDDHSGETMFFEVPLISAP